MGFLNLGFDMCLLELSPQNLQGLLFVIGLITGIIVCRIVTSKSKAIDPQDKWIHAEKPTNSNRPISNSKPVFCSKHGCNEWINIDREFNGYAYCDLHKIKRPPKPLHNPHK